MLYDDKLFWCIATKPKIEFEKKYENVCEKRNKYNSLSLRLWGLCKVAEQSPDSDLLIACGLTDQHPVDLIPRQTSVERAPKSYSVVDNDVSVIDIQSPSPSPPAPTCDAPLVDSSLSILREIF